MLTLYGALAALSLAALLAVSYVLLYLDLSGYSDIAIAVGSFTGSVMANQGVEGFDAFFGATASTWGRAS